MLGMSISMASQRPAGGSTFPLSGASIDMNFVTSQYFGGTLGNLMNVDQTQATGALLTLLANNAGGTLLLAFNILPFTPVATEFWFINDSNTNKFIYGSSGTQIRSTAGASTISAGLGSAANFTTSAVKIASAWDGTGRTVVGNGGTAGGNATPYSGVTASVFINPSLNILRDCRRLTAWTTRLDIPTLQALTL